MTIVVEDGSIVQGANSFVSLDDFYTYIDSTGAETQGDDEAALIKAANYISGLEDKLKGKKVSRDQSLAFPRSDFEAEGWEWSSAEIPRQVINAQLSLALELLSGEDLYNPSVRDLPVIEESIEGAVTVKYANPNTALKVNKERPSQVHINLLLKRGGLTLIRS